MNYINNLNKTVMKANGAIIGVLFLIIATQVLEFWQMWRLESYALGGMQWFYLLLTPLIIWRVIKSLGKAFSLTNFLNGYGQTQMLQMLGQVINSMYSIAFLKLVSLFIVGKTMVDGVVTFEQVVMVVSNLIMLVLIVKVTILNAKTVMRTKVLY